MAEYSPLMLLLGWMLQEKTTLLEGIYLHTVFKNVVAVIFSSVEIISYFNNQFLKNVFAGNFPKPMLGLIFHASTENTRQAKAKDQFYPQIEGFP